MYKLYILQSEDLKHFYIGVSSNLTKRLKKHNSGSTKSTKPYKPWNIIYYEVYSTKQEAMKREYYLKHPKGYLEKKKIIEKNSLNHGEVA